MKDNSIHTIYKIILALSLICILFSVIIYIENRQLAAKKQDFCSAITGTNGCETVQTSKFGKTLGISNVWYGIVGFILLGIFSSILIKKDNKIIRYLTTAGGFIAGFVSILFLYLQTLVIHAYCIFCLFVDTFSLIILGLTIYLLFKTTRHK